MLFTDVHCYIPQQSDSSCPSCSTVRVLICVVRHWCVFGQVGVSESDVGGFESALALKAEANLVDMDEHLDDVTKDWRNSGIEFAS